MQIQRTSHGDTETIDLGTRAGYLYFAREVVQSFEAADELVEELQRRGSADVNADAPEFYEAYVVVANGPVFKSLEYWLIDAGGRRVAGPYTTWDEAHSSRRGADLLIDEVHVGDHA